MTAPARLFAAAHMRAHTAPSPSAEAPEPTTARDTASAAALDYATTAVDTARELGTTRHYAGQVTLSGTELLDMLCAAYAAGAPSSATGSGAYTVHMPDTAPTLDQACDPDQSPTQGQCHATLTATGQVAVWDLADDLDVPDVILSVEDVAELLPVLARLVTDHQQARQRRRTEAIEALAVQMHAHMHENQHMRARSCECCLRAAAIAHDHLNS